MFKKDRVLGSQASNAIKKLRPPNDKQKAMSIDINHLQLVNKASRRQQIKHTKPNNKLRLGKN